MSTDKLDRVTAIASRQPALNPAQDVLPAVLEFRLQQVTTDRDQLVQVLTEILTTAGHEQFKAVERARALLKAQDLPSMPIRSKP